MDDSEATKRQMDPNVGGGVDRDKLKDSDFVFSDSRTFPIVTPGDVQDAVSSWGRYKGPHSFEEFKRRLTALCRRKGAAFVAALPEAWDVKALGLPADGIAVKGAFEMDILGCPFGGPFEGKDSQGQYFDQRTNFQEDRFALPPLVYYHGFTPEGKPQGDPVYIGRTVKRWVDQAGVWYHAVLDDTLELARRAIEGAKQGIARASSGAVAHLCRYDADGHIREWPVAELSVFDTGEGRTPANSYAVALPVMKAVYTRAGMSLPDGIEPPGARAKGDPEGSQADAGAGANGQNSEDKEIETMDDGKIQELIAQGVQSALKAQQDAAAAEAQTKASFDAAVKAEVEKQVAASRRLPGGGDAPYAMKYGGIAKFDNWEIDDLAFWVTFTNTALKSGNVKAQRLGDGIYRALAVRVMSEGDKTQQGRNGLKAMAAYPFAALKSDEVMQYDLANYGDEWVRSLYADNLWYKIRFGTPVLDHMAPYMVPVQGAEELIMLLEGTDAIWYKVAEAASLPTTELTGIPNATFTSSRMGSAKQNLTLGKIGCRVMVSGELGEATPISVVSEVRKNMEVSGQEAIENVAINGDTDATATTNINDIAGTPAATELFLVANGFRKLCLITNTANGRDGGALAIEDFKDTLKLMGTAGVNALADPSKVSFILDPSTWAKAMELAELKTQDVYNPGATVITGKLPRVWGCETILSAQMCKVSTAGSVIANSQLTEATGKIDTDTPTDNTKGGLLAVRWDQWRMGYRRKMTFEATRVARADLTELVSLAEMGIVYRDTEAAALTYNLTV